MKLTLRAGALAAALVLAPLPALSDDQPKGVDLPHIKAALRITSAQQPYWAPVEAVLLDIAARHAQARETGIVERARQRVVTIVLDSAAIARLTQAARPLAQTLSEEQKRAAQQLAREMGLTHVLMAALR